VAAQAAASRPPGGEGAGSCRQQGSSPPATPTPPGHRRSRAAASGWPRGQRPLVAYPRRQQGRRSPARLVGAAAHSRPDRTRRTPSPAPPRRPHLHPPTPGHDALALSVASTSTPVRPAMLRSEAAAAGGTSRRRWQAPQRLVALRAMTDRHADDLNRRPVRRTSTLRLPSDQRSACADPIRNQLATARLIDLGQLVPLGGPS
jgi:hypothetical protein